MTGYCNYLDFTESSLFGKLFCESSHNVARHHNFREKVGADAGCLQQSFIYLLVVRVQELRGGEDSVFAHHLSCQQIRQRIGQEQHLVGSLQRRVTLAVQRKELEQRIEVHELDTGAAINLILGHNLEVLLHHTVGIMVTVRAWLGEDMSVLTNAYYVHTPCVDTDR